MAKKVSTPRIMDLERGVAGSPGQIYAAVTASGPAVSASPPPTDLSVTANVLALSAQTPMARISLQWRKPLQAQEVRQYQVQVATDSGFTTGIIYHQASDTSISIDVVTNTSGIAYWFRVRVLSGGIVSAWSNSVTATSAIDATPAGQPTSLAWSWDGGDLILSWTNPTSTNMKDMEVRIWDSASKTVLYHTGYSTTSRYLWTLPQQRIDTGGTLDPAVYFELRSRTWANVLGTPTVPGTNPTNAAPSAPASIALINSLGSLTISVTATPPSDFQAYRYRIIQTSPSAADVVFDSPSAIETYSLYAQATYQVGVKVLDVYGQLSSETLSSTSIIDTLTIGSLRADVIYSDSDGNSDATLHVPLSNGTLTGGPNYGTTTTWNKWVRAERPMLDRYRVLTIAMTPTLGTTSWYVRLSSDGSTWSYYAGPVTGSRVLTAVASQAAAQAAAVSAATLGGASTSKVELPATIEARYVEVWMTNGSGASTQLHEFYPRRLVEADDVYVQNLSSISANIGTITAGTINSVTINSSTINAGGGSIVLDPAGMSIVRDTSSTAGARPNLPGYVPGATHSMRFVNGATVHGYVGQTSDTYSSPATVVNELLIANPGVTGQQSNITLFSDHSTQSSEVRLISQSSAELAYLEVMANTGAGISYIRGVAETVYIEGELQTSYSVNGSGATQIRNTNSGSSAYGALYLGNNTDVTSGILRNSSTNTGYAGANSLSLFHIGNYPIGFVTNNTLRMTISNGGMVGVGVTPFSNVRLAVDGANASAGSYAMLVRNSTPTNLIAVENNGALTNINAWSVSDAREKTEIEDADPAMIDLLDKLRVRRYKRTISGWYEVGLVAQEVQAVYPEIVRETPEGILTIRHADIMMLLLAAFKREKAIVRNLRQRIIALEAA